MRRVMLHGAKMLNPLAVLSLFRRSSTRGTLIDGTQFDSSYDRGQPSVWASVKGLSECTRSLA